MIHWVTGFFVRWARTEKAISIASCLGILASIVAFLAMGDKDVAAMSIFGLVVVLASMPYHARRVERMRRGKEILNRYNPERNRRPLGI